MIIYVRTVGAVITLVAYAFLIVFIIIGNVTFAQRFPNSNITFPTVSEIIDESTENTSVYLIFATIYASIKFLLIVLTLMDSEIVFSELVEKRINRVSDNMRSLFVFLSGVAALFAAIQLLTLVCLVFVPISKVPSTHLFVAAITFGSALFKSFLLLLRRTLIYDLLSVYFISNIIYFVAFFAVTVAFYFERAGLLEYVLVFLILFENVFLTIEYYDLIIQFTVRLDPRRGNYSLRTKKSKIEDEEEDSFVI